MLFKRMLKLLFKRMSFLIKILTMVKQNVFKKRVDEEKAERQQAVAKSLSPLQYESEVTV